MVMGISTKEAITKELVGVIQGKEVITIIMTKKEPMNHIETPSSKDV